MYGRGVSSRIHLADAINTALKVSETYTIVDMPVQLKEIRPSITRMLFLFWGWVKY